jgi:hypothetical protein
MVGVPSQTTIRYSLWPRSNTLFVTSPYNPKKSCYWSQNDGLPWSRKPTQPWDKATVENLARRDRVRIVPTVPRRAYEYLKQRLG